MNLHIKTHIVLRMHICNSKIRYIVAFIGPHKVTLILSPVHSLFLSPTLHLYDYTPLVVAIDIKHIKYMCVYIHLYAHYA